MSGPAADNRFVDRCAQCGAALARGAGWCGQCFAVAGTPVPAPVVGFVPGGGPPREVLTRKTRWAKTTTTFGPVGRICCTLALLAVLAVLVVGGTVVMFAWGGAAIWAGVIMPWALRDIWQVGQLPIG